MTAAQLRALRAAISTNNAEQRVTAAWTYVTAADKAPALVRVWARLTERGTCAQRRARRQLIDRIRVLQDR